MYSDFRQNLSLGIVEMENIMKMNEEHRMEEKSEDYLYRIGMFAQMNHITIKALRFYEEQGLLYPAKIDEESGYRYYKMSQMETIHRILALKEAGFKIDDIKHLADAEDAKAFLIQKKNEVLAKIAELTLQLSRLDAYLMNGTESMATPVRIRKIPACVCATMISRIESYDDLFEVMPQMGALMEEAGCLCAVPEYCFTNYLEPGYKDENILIETCEAVREHGEAVEGLTFKEFPETEVVSIYHKGSYADFSRTYETILKYIEENGYEICGNIRENYIDGAWNKDSETEWLSEIQIPVQKKQKA